MEEHPPVITPQQGFRLEISADNSLKTNCNDPEILQQILDTTTLRQTYLLNHERRLTAESNRAALLIGIVFASFIGLFVFCLVQPQPQTQEVSHVR